MPDAEWQRIVDASDPDGLLDAALTRMERALERGGVEGWHAMDRERARIAQLINTPVGPRKAACVRLRKLKKRLESLPPGASERGASWGVPTPRSLAGSLGVLVARCMERKCD